MKITTILFKNELSVNELAQPCAKAKKMQRWQPRQPGLLAHKGYWTTEDFGYMLMDAA